MYRHKIWTVLISVLFLFSARSVSAGSIAEETDRLAGAAKVLEKISDEEYIEEARGGALQGVPFATRHEALESLYKTLAALEYRQSLSGGLAESKAGAAEEARDRLAEDAGHLAIDPETLSEASWWGRVQAQMRSYAQRQRVRTPAVVAAVRGGREIRTKTDRDIAKINKSLESVSRDFKGDLPAQKKADLHFKAGRIYEKLAKVVAKEKGFARAAPVEKPAPAPLRTAVPQLSPSDIYKHYGPAVVLLMCVGEDGNGELGTGSIIDDSGRVLTNAHVVIRRSTGRPFDAIRVYFKPRHLTGDPKRDLTDPILGRVVSFDQGLDLAIVELASRPTKAIRPIPLGDAGGVEAGEPVLAIGHPEQGGLWTLTTGVVSTVIADLGGVKGKNVFQTDASINRGNSGGPLLDNKGSLIGVNTSMARKAKDGLAITSVNFSVKSDVVKDWLAKAGVKADYYQADTAPYEAEAAPAPAEARPAPKPAAAKPAPEPVAVKPEPAKTEPAQAKPRPVQKPEIITPKKPFSIQSLIQREIAQMEDLESEMRGEIDKRRDWIQDHYQKDQE